LTADVEAEQGKWIGKGRRRGYPCIEGTLWHEFVGIYAC
jgi:hypothetical protein